MGTIGDLFADQLASFANVGEVDEGSPSTAPDLHTVTSDSPDSHGADSLTFDTAASDAENGEVSLTALATELAQSVQLDSPLAKVVEAILEETGYPAEKMRLDLRLAKDLELDGLSLWSLVARLERELKITCPDAEVEGWQTVADLLTLASS